jgi:hypothetical protein
MLALAGIMAAVAGVLLVLGLALVRWGSGDVLIFGWLTLGWGLGGLGAALVLVIRAWRR